VGYELVSIDEASFQLTTNYKRIWFFRGEKPKRAFFWSNKKITVFGALTNTHKFYYDLYDSQNSLTFRHFIRGLCNWLNPNKKYVFILDNAGFHKTQCVKNLLKEYDWVTVEHIPPYSPELNPIETCWKVTKNAVTKSQYFKTIDGLQDALENFWEDHIFTQNFITYLCR
jgi:transposase